MTTNASYGPTHDEIAFAAFLAWEKDGRPNGQDGEFWLGAEAELRSMKSTRVEAKVWPPKPSTARLTPAKMKTEKLATVAGRTTTVKAAGKKSRSEKGA